MTAHPFYFWINSTLPVYNVFSVRTPVPAVQFPRLPSLTLLGAPTVVVFLWILKHLISGTIAFGWSAFAELVLPLGACFFAAVVFLVPNPMHALLSLLGVFFTTVLFYLAAGIAFVGLVFLIVYVGAVAVLFLFVIMLLNVKSLTSKEALLRHLTQWLAIVSAIVLFYQLQFHIFTATSLALIGGNVRLTMTALTGSDAVLFYVRYGAADINRLVGLYTEDAPAFLVTTIFLLVSLLGAIILATVTTERATALTDIRKYDNCIAASVVSLLVFDGGFLVELLDFSSTSSETSKVVFMSLYTPFSHRNREVIALNLEQGDATRLRAVDPRRKRLPRLAPPTESACEGGVLLFKKRVYEPLPTEQKKKKSLLRRVLTYPSRKGLPLEAVLARRSLHFECVSGISLSECRRVGLYKQTRLRSKYDAAITPVIANWTTKEILRRYDAPMCRSRWLWHWRPERATSLLRTQKVVRFWSPKEREYVRLNRLPFWRRRLRTLASPFTFFNLGLIGYFRYRYNVQLLPFLFYWAWRGRAFFALWLFLMILFPCILVPFPWFLDDYDILWPRLQRLHETTYYFVERYTVFTASSPWLFKEILTLLLLYPAAALNIALENSQLVLLVTALYAYDAVLFTGGDFARAELHDSTCNYFRIYANKIIHRPPTEQELVRRRRHPDKGRLDVSFPISLVLPNLDVPLPGSTATDSIDFTAWMLDLGRTLHRLEFTPRWVFDNNIYYPLPTTILAVFLLLASLLYSLCSLFLVLNWVRIYGERGRPSLLWPIIVLFVTVFVGIVLYPHMVPFYKIFNLPSSYGNLPIARYILLFIALGLIVWVPYVWYRNCFVNYQRFAYGNISLFRRFVNYYIKYIYWWRQFYRTRVEEFTARPLSELQIEEDAHAVLRKQATEQLGRIFNRWTFVHYKRVKKHHDPEPNPQCRPRRSASHAYLQSPFSGRRLVRPIYKRRLPTK